MSKNIFISVKKLNYVKGVLDIQITYKIGDNKDSLISFRGEVIKDKWWKRIFIKMLFLMANFILKR